MTEVSSTWAYSESTPGSDQDQGSLQNGFPSQGESLAVILALEPERFVVTVFSPHDHSRTRLETLEGPEHQGPIFSHLPGLDAKLKGSPKRQTNLCATSDFQKGREAGGTKMKR